MQRWPRQMWERRLQGIKIVIERQQRVPTECHNHCLLGLGQDGGMRDLRPGLQILDRRRFPPLSDRLWVDPQLTAQRRKRSLRRCIAARAACVVVALP